MKKKSKDIKFNTKSIHIGSDPDPINGSISPAIYATSTYVQKAPADHYGYEYTRTHNPTRSRLEECLASLENGKHCATTSSGMAALSLVLHNLPKGSKILCGDDVYGGTYRQLTTIFNEVHQVEFIDTSDTKKTKKKIEEFKPDLVWIETPTNPLLKISDINEISKSTKKVKALLAVDNTFMTPYFQKPLELGADIVIHSLTKYLNGHSDALGGAIISGHNKFMEGIRYLQNSMGPSLSPFESFLILRGMKTLGIRMDRHQENAMKIAKFLEKHPKIENVIYPGLKTHPQYKVAKKQMSGFGGMMSVNLKTNISGAKRFIKNLSLFSLAESLGGVESLIEQPATMTHASVPKKIRESIGIKDGLIRISVGIENSEDLISDLDYALGKI
jgi:cystathionine gamma-lyase